MKLYRFPKISPLKINNIEIDKRPKINVNCIERFTLPKIRPRFFKDVHPIPGVKFKDEDIN